MDSLKYGLVWASLCYVLVASQPTPETLETVIGNFKKTGPRVKGEVSVIDESTLQIKGYDMEDKGKLPSKCNQKLHNV